MLLSNTDGMKILIIDDNPTLLNVFAKLLEIKGFFVTAEITFEAGLCHLENESYDVLFVDFPLDDYTEKQILTLLKENHIFQKTNVFLFSSVDFDNSVLDEWKTEGLHSYLKKPVKRSTIINALDAIRTKHSFTSQTLSESIVDDEQATPEQLEQLNQLEKLIRELESIQESISPPESENERASKKPKTTKKTTNSEDKKPKTTKKTTNSEDKKPKTTKKTTNSEDKKPKTTKKPISSGIKFFC